MIEHEFVEVNGVRLHAATAGDGPVVLFLHGFPEFWYLWRRQLEEFGRDHLAVAPDLRGYNLSDKPAGTAAYAMPELIGDVAGLLEHYSGGRPAVLVGHDWGGALAWAYALAHPETLDRLVIVNAPHPIVFLRELSSSEAQREASSYMHFFRRPDAEERLARDRFQALDAIVFGASARPDTASAEDRRAYLEAWSQPGALTGALNYYRAAPAGPPRNAAEGDAARAVADRLLASRSYTLRVPTLVIWGMLDTALLAGNLDGLEEHVPDLRIERVPDGTHWVINEQPQRVNAAIRAFLAT